MNKRKWLWVVIIALMVFGLFAMTFEALEMLFGFKIGTLDIMGWLGFYIMPLLPVVLCSLIVLIKQYKMLWLIAVPSTIQMIIWLAAENLIPACAGLMMLYPWLNFMSGCIMVALAYLCMLVAKITKKTKNTQKK